MKSLPLFQNSCSVIARSLPARNAFSIADAGGRRGNLKRRADRHSLDRLGIAMTLKTSFLVSLSLYLLVYSSLRLLIPFPAFAQGEGQNAQAKQNPYWRKDTRSVVKEVEDGSEKEVTSARFTFTQFNNTLSAMGSGILDPTGQNQSAVSQIGQGIALVIGHPAVNTQEYLAYMGAKAGFIPQAYAAQARGGFDVLGPIQKLWVATRNVAYLITSLILVVIGFMIMLRKKIDAQTVVGVQQALPGLVVTLLLITFSYAIAGFVIDMIYFLIFFGIKLLALNNVFAPGDYGNAAIELIRTKSLFTIGLGRLFHWGTAGDTGTIETAADAIGNLTENLMSGVLGGTLGGAVAGFLSQPIAFVIFAVAILYALFKLFFALLMSYIQIILLAILGPLQIMLNALPGSDAFSKWFRNLLANAMAFPAAAMMIVFAAALMGQTSAWKINSGIGFTDTNAGVKWTAPLIFGGEVGRGNPADAVLALLGMGILLMTPKVVEMVKEAFQAPEFKYGSAIGEAIGFGGRAPAYMTRTAGSGREYMEALRYADPTSPHYDPAYMNQLMFTNPQLFTRVTRGLSGGTRGRVIQGLGYTFGIGRK